ncbi:MAG: hypothetical protein ACFNVK_08215, partial [Prevotella sp.]
EGRVSTSTEIVALRVRIHQTSPAPDHQGGTKPTLARIVFLRLDERLVDKKGTHNVKIPTENKTKTIEAYKRI